LIVGNETPDWRGPPEEVSAYLEREELTTTVRRMAIQHLVLGAELDEPARLRKLLEPMLEEFVVLALKHTQRGMDVEVEWREPKRPTRRPKKRKRK
jgi:hypothetical protein